MIPPPLPTCDVSLIVCTRNRAERLGRMLASAAAMRRPEGVSLEVIIVDNGSKDATCEVVLGFADQLPLRRLIEETPGHSNARNRGIAEAGGRHIVWTDDDVVIDADCLVAYAQAFRRFPEAGLFGGRILPELEPPAPAWFESNMLTWPLVSVLAHRDMGDEVSPITHDGGRTPYGANFALRAEIQRQFPYDPNLGLSPGRKRTGDESDVIYRILKAGWSGWWVPDAKVRHIIPAERQTRDYIEQYFRQVGETAAYLRDVRPGDNVGETKRRPLFSYFDARLIGLYARLHETAATTAKAAGLEALSLRSLARSGFYRGIAEYRRPS
jgi:glycosyltransferase involved in cell wall biosynthesis